MQVEMLRVKIITCRLADICLDDLETVGIFDFCQMALGVQSAKLIVVNFVSWLMSTHKQNPCQILGEAIRIMVTSCDLRTY